MIAETTQELARIIQENTKVKTVLNAGSIVEVSKLPVIVLNGPALTEKKRLMRDPERITVIDKEAGKARREIPPRWYDLRFDVNISCEDYWELLGLFERLSRINQSCPLLTAKRSEFERQYLWRWEKSPSVSTIPNISQVHQGKAGIIVYDVEVYSGIYDELRLIEKINAEIYSDIYDEMPVAESTGMKKYKDKIEVQE